MLDANKIRSSIALSLQAKISKVEVFEELKSTNDYLLHKGVNADRARICLAESQSSGRGRRGNEWLSAPNKNIMMSISWGFESWPKAISGLSLAIGMVVATRLNDSYNIGVKLKWPNDLLIGEEKLGGILIDLKGDVSSGCSAVIGLGLNVWQTNWASANAGYRWTDLKAHSIEPDRSELAGLLCEDIVQVLMGFETAGLTPLLAVWNKLSSYSGKTISVIGDSGNVNGVMVGIDDYGALLLDGLDGKRHRFQDSNVSVRILEGIPPA